MLAANPQFDIGPGCAATGRGQLEQLANAFNIEANKRVAREDPLLDVGTECSPSAPVAQI